MAGIDDFFKALGGQGSYEEHAREWAKNIYIIHDSLIRAGFTVEQAFEIVKIELAASHQGRYR